MPYAIAWEPRGVVKHYFGFVSGAEFVRSVIEVTGSDRFDGLQFIINDFIDADDHSINQASFEEIAAIRYGASITRSAIRTIVITTAPRFIAVADAVNSALPNGVPRTEVFSTPSLARTWLEQQPLLSGGRTLRGSQG